MQEIDREFLPYLKLLKKRGRMYGCCYPLEQAGFIKEGKTRPDGQGGYTVEYYVITEKGEAYLAEIEKNRLKKVKRFLSVAWKIIIGLASIAGVVLQILKFLPSNGTQ